MQETSCHQQKQDNGDCHTAMLHGNALQTGYAALSCRLMLVPKIADQPAASRQSGLGVSETRLRFVDFHVVLL